MEKKLTEKNEIHAHHWTRLSIEDQKALPYYTRLSFIWTAVICVYYVL